MGFAFKRRVGTRFGLTKLLALMRILHPSKDYLGPCGTGALGEYTLFIRVKLAVGIGYACGFIVYISFSNNTMLAEDCFIIEVVSDRECPLLPRMF